MAHDPVNHPPHYQSHPSGIECIQITEHMTFNLGSAVKYLFRAGKKSEDPTEDLQKAQWYIEREQKRRSTETWAVFPQDDRYEVSTQGRVRRIDTGRLRNPTRLKNGYMTFMLLRDGKRKLHYVHRAVVETFLGPIPKGHVVAHGDGSRDNNALWNLRVDTVAGNLADTRAHGTHRVGGQNPASKLTSEQADEIRHRTEPESQLAEEYEVSRATIGRIRRGESWYDPRLEAQRLFDQWCDGEPDGDLVQAVSAIWRAGFKGDAVQDLEKAAWYLDRAISQRKETPTDYPETEPGNVQVNRMDGLARTGETSPAETSDNRRSSTARTHPESTAPESASPRPEDVPDPQPGEAWEVDADDYGVVNAIRGDDSWTFDGGTFPGRLYPAFRPLRRLVPETTGQDDGQVFDPAYIYTDTDGCEWEYLDGRWIAGTTHVERVAARKVRAGIASPSAEFGPYTRIEDNK